MTWFHDFYAITVWLRFEYSIKLHIWIDLQFPKQIAPPALWWSWTVLRVMYASRTQNIRIIVVVLRTPEQEPSLPCHTLFFPNFWKASGAVRKSLPMYSCTNVSTRRTFTGEGWCECAIPAPTCSAINFIELQNIAVLNNAEISGVDILCSCERSSWVFPNQNKTSPQSVY